MRKMTLNGIAIGLLTAILVWTTTRIGSGDIHSFAAFLSGTGNNSYLWGTNLLLIGWALYLRRPSIAWLALKIDGAVLLVVHSFKILSENVMLGQWTWRPNGSPDGFPSGHATHAFAMAFLMSYFFPRFWLLWYSLAASIAWSRIEMSAHTPFQVTAGICFGLAIGYGFVHNWRTHPEPIKHCEQSSTKIAA
jgi:membrane-associated phospholipid phosphatase